MLDSTPAIRQVIDSLTSERSLTPFYINAYSGNRKVDIEKRVQPPVEAWLRAFMDAEFVVTDSFHACVFSILFHKPFAVCVNSGRGVSRLHSLLEAFGLSNRLIQREGDSLKDLPPIDWDDVDKRLLGYRQESQKFLSESLRLK